MPNADPPLTVGLLQTRLLQCMRRVVLVEIELDGELSPEMETYDAAQTYTYAAVDAAVTHDFALPEPIVNALSPHAAIYVIHERALDLRECRGFTPYISWPGMTMCVRQNYSPTAHARSLLMRRRPNEAYEVLINVPAVHQISSESKAAIAVEIQWCFLAFAASSDARTALNLLFREQEQFFVATAIAPIYAPSFACHARHWQLIGRPDMARRLLQTYLAVAPSPELEDVLAHVPDEPPPRYEAASPACAFTPGSQRLVIVCHEGSDYGLDTLYDGLCDVLGDYAVIEVPWKATLHGQHPERAEGYPCVYTRHGEPQPLSEIEKQLRDGQFDAVCVADTLKTLDPRGLNQLMRAAGDTPLVILDTWDEGGDYRDDVLQFLGRSSCAAYFKREMLAGIDYGSNAYPLPFAYSERNIATEDMGERDLPLFWAGKPAAGLRPLYLRWLESAHGIDPYRRLDPRQYREALRRSRIGINLFGYGFDTVRYWEVPAHGAMLLSERPPTCIPHNFVDGVHAVFFDDLPDLEAKLDYYMHRQDEAAAIAAAGREHFLRFHTAEARARQFVSQLANLLHWR